MKGQHKQLQRVPAKPPPAFDVLKTPCACHFDLQAYSCHGGNASACTHGEGHCMDAYWRDKQAQPLTRSALYDWQDVLMPDRSECVARDAA